LVWRGNFLGAIVNSPLPASGGRQRIWTQLGAFLLAHRMIWLAALLCIIAAQPLAFRLFQLVFQHMF
jgi:hypothetical protein